MPIAAMRSTLRGLLALTAGAILLPTMALAQETTSQQGLEGSQHAAKPLVVQAPDVVPEGGMPPAGTMRRFERCVDDYAGKAKDAIALVLLYDLSEPFTDESDGEDHIDVPAVAAYLVLGSLFFTVYFRFINIRAFKHSILVIAGKYDDETDPGEVSHFQALMAALSATVGLGNIAGVAVAIGTGGPGATFWMIVCGFLGMSSKFTECTLGQKYREVRPDGRIMGGAMYYLSHGLKEIGLGPIGPILGVVFAILCILASFGGGNAFQVNQSMNAVSEQLTFLEGRSWIFGLAMMILVGLVILGGIKRIAHVAEKIVPFMCVLYVLACLWVLLVHFSEIPAAFALILRQAFTPSAAYGGFLGVLFMGVKRAFFSNEAGVGSAPIAHSAAKTDYPIREGIVGLMAPFIDTVVICTMTALVIVITGAYASDDPEIQRLIATDQGSALTAAALGRAVSWFPVLLSIAVSLFAYSTMISWSYYGERCWAYLFGDASSIVYRILFLICTFLGAIVSATNILVLSTLMLLSMSIPNIVGLVLLAPQVRRDLDEYWRMYKSGEFDKPSSRPSPPVPEKTT